jgi:putative DNA primase/helicase
MKTTEQAVLELSQAQQEALIRTFGLEETNTRHIDCPFCGKKNKGGDGCRISYTNKLGGDYQYASICAGCGPKGIMGMLYGVGADIHAINREIGFKYGSDATAKPIETKTRESRLIELFKTSRPVSESENILGYLRGRGIQITPSYCVRFAPKLAYRNASGQVIGNFDAMISCATNALGRPAFMHITWLENSKKIDLGSENPARKQYSLQPDGIKPRCSVKFKNRAPEVLAVAEGIESALSYEQIYSVPAESCLNAGLLEDYRPPEYVRELHIARDTDKKWAGHAAAHKLLHSIACNCHWVTKIVMRGPRQIGEDFNDILLTGGDVDELVWVR